MYGHKGTHQKRASGIWSVQIQKFHCHGSEGRSPPHEHDGTSHSGHWWNLSNPGWLSRCLQISSYEMFVKIKQQCKSFSASTLWWIIPWHEYLANWLPSLRIYFLGWVNSVLSLFHSELSWNAYALSNLPPTITLWCIIWWKLLFPGVTQETIWLPVCD